MFNQYKGEMKVKRYIVLLLLVTSAVRCDVTEHDFNFAADVEQTYKKAKKRDEHCDRVAQVINNVVTVQRCEAIARDLVFVNSKEAQRTFGAILDDIRAQLSHEDNQRFGKILKKMGSIFELLSSPDGESERVAMQVQAKLIVLNRLVTPYLKACEKHVDDKKSEQGQQVGQEIVRQFFKEWKMFCADQQKRFEEK
jgi:hypothetical protein